MSKHDLVVGHMKCSSTSGRALASRIDLPQCKRDGLKISEIGLVKKVGRRQGQRHHETKPHRPQEEDDSPTTSFSGGGRRDNFYLLLLLLLLLPPPRRGAKATLSKTEASEYNYVGCTGRQHLRETNIHERWAFASTALMVLLLNGIVELVHINACNV
ncbi:hypothetical protein MUK42_26976 [Musa troglodytarum]|uniref:Uncharacterized protein n=1 Tax=Musa troglodytarum TaxID=320322 RepID=A0A9E7FGQ8_9LILI|nr:hypothetical protein MUK42_26976 [Musa troglodytarum]